uniref:Uncharacterized protein n=1 Tax=Graphocephala atropunctata TaxID=36148 RepID=A0A1B6MS21_9HEMI
MYSLARYSFRRAVSLLRFGRCYSEIPDREKPVKFTTSEAVNWRAAFSRQGNIYDDTPDAQPYIVSISTGIFIVYFLLWREESDVDETFNITRSIYDRVEDLEEVQLKVQRKECLNRGKDVREIDIRLRELERVRLAKTGQSQSQ